MYIYNYIYIYIYIYIYNVFHCLYSVCCTAHSSLVCSGTS